jgi:hypothetical protein
MCRVHAVAQTCRIKNRHKTRSEATMFCVVLGTPGIQNLFRNYEFRQNEGSASQVCLRQPTPVCPSPPGLEQTVVCEPLPELTSKIHYIPVAIKVKGLSNSAIYVILKSQVLREIRPLKLC